MCVRASLKWVGVCGGALIDICSSMLVRLRLLDSNPAPACVSVCVLPWLFSCCCPLLQKTPPQVCKEVQESHGKLLKDWIKGIQGESAGGWLNGWLVVSVCQSKHG